MISIFRPLRIFCDNLATVFLAKNNKSGVEARTLTPST